MSADLTDRQRRILGRLVGEFIDQGEPISSSWLADRSGLGLSSATVRSILARLEEQGLVRQPHTSAGRVPTDAGYRLYVNWYLGSRRRSKGAADIEARLRKAGTVGDVLEDVSHTLSEASQHIGFALAPSSPTTRLRHIDFVPLENGRVLVIVVATGGQITHKVVDAHSAHDATALGQAANYINAEFTGLTLLEARAAIMERLRQDRQLYDALLARALELARSGLDEVATEGTLHVQGASFMLADVREVLSYDMLRSLFRMIEERHGLVDLLTHYIESDGLTVVIGSEHLAPDLRPFSLVASTFRDGDRVGTIGVIGPTRMRYQRAIPMVESVSDALTRVLDRQ